MAIEIFMKECAYLGVDQSNSISVSLASKVVLLPNQFLKNTLILYQFKMVKCLVFRLSYLSVTVPFCNVYLPCFAC